MTSTLTSDGQCRPIFLVGAPRSGTTLLRSMLDSHPHICCPTWETGAFDKFADLINGDVKYHTNPKNGTVIERGALVGWFRQSFSDLMKLLTAGSGKTRWGEKTPAHVLHMDLIREVYPEAQFVHIIRNGRDVVRSLQNMPWAPRRIQWSCRRWVNSVEAGRASGRKLPSGDYLELTYEQLLAEPESVLSRLCQFLGEPYDAQMLEFHRPANNSWGIAAAPLAGQPIHEYRALSLLERLVFLRIGQRLQRELGYR